MNPSSGASTLKNIIVSSNFARLLGYFAFETRGRDARAACAGLKAWMDAVQTDGRAVPASVLARRDFVAERVSNEKVRALCSLAHAG